MRRFRVAVVAAGLLFVVLACSARMERALELAWDDMTTTLRDHRGGEVILIGPIQ
jgi:hypothetical protein